MARPAVDTSKLTEAIGSRFKTRAAIIEISYVGEDALGETWKVQTYSADRVRQTPLIYSDDLKDALLTCYDLLAKLIEPQHPDYHYAKVPYVTRSCPLLPEGT